MNAPFQFTPQATEDLDAIWWFIAKHNRGAADRVEMEIAATCRWLARHPQMGTKRQDTKPLPVSFWTLSKFPITRSPIGQRQPLLQIVAVLHGKRDRKTLLEGRS
jgi:plasmid stabilization system protein ParE